MIPEVTSLGKLCTFLITTMSACAQLVSSPPDAREQQNIIERIMREALRYQGQLPDFICDKLTVRSEDKTGTGAHWKQRDTLEERIHFSGGRAAIRLLKVNGKPTRLTHLKVGGMIEDDLLGFAIVPDWIFGARAKAQLDWSGWAMVDGKRQAVFAFRVRPSISMTPGKKTFQVGFHGLVYASAETGTVMRLEVHTDGPRDYPFQESSSEIEYGVVTVSGKELILPVQAVAAGRSGNYRFSNAIQFFGYRKFSTDSTITFGEQKTEQEK